MAAHVDVKRYNIISLLYIISICFSVLQIKMSILDSDAYAIKTYEYLAAEQEKQITLSNNIIKLNEVKFSKDAITQGYLTARARIDASKAKVDAYINLINGSLAKSGLTIFTEFNKRSKVEAIFKKDSSIYKLKDELFDLAHFLKNSKYGLATKFQELVPIEEEVPNLKGKKKEWTQFLFFHKPTAVSYLQLLRIKLLLEEAQLTYQEAALAKIGYVATYFSAVDKKFYEMKNKMEKIVPEAHKLEDVKKIELFKEVTAFDSLIQNVVNSLHTENIFVGVNSSILSDFGYVIGKDFQIDINPKATIVRAGNSYKVFFNKVGEYELRFTDLREGKNKFLFTKKVRVNPLPDPIVHVKGNNLNSYAISKKELLSADRLQATLDINSLNYFPGRINGFKVIRLHNGMEQEAVMNNGELFQAPTQKLMGNLIKNDIIIFDQINISLVDGSSRNPAPLILKIVD